MKHFVFTLFACALLSAAAIKAETVVVGFEEFAAQIGTNYAWNGTDRDFSGQFPDGFLTATGGTITGFYGMLEVPEYSFQSQGVTFYTTGGDESMGMGFWAGTGLSTVTENSHNGFQDEMAATPGSGNNGSQTYAVVYGDCTNNLSYDSNQLVRISLPTDAIVSSIAITNNIYTSDSLGAGLGSSGTSLPTNPVTHAGEAFGINIFGIGFAGELINSLQVNLADWRNDAPFVLMDWLTVNFDAGWAGVSELRFGFFTTIDGDDSPWGFWTPAYFAFDDLTFEIQNGSAATPEPATLLIFGLGILAAGICTSRKKKQNEKNAAV